MPLRTLSARCSSLLLLALAGCASCGGGGGKNDDDGGVGPGPTCATSFSNPVAEGADPWVTRHAGAYYFVESRNNGIWVYKTDTLTKLKRNGVMVWAAPTSGWNRANVWAPELHFLDGKWYIYYAAGASGTAGATFVNQRAGVLESSGTDPQGPYVDRGMLYTGDDVAGGTDPKWAIDFTVGRIGGQLYGAWSGWEANSTTTDRVRQHLYIARMSSPTAVATNRVQIGAPFADWERGTELDLQEGPSFLVNGTHTFLVYSTRESWMRDYRLGLLRLAAPNADPLSAASWAKGAGPVFVGAGDAYGVGHASFTTSPDGTEPWIVFHSKSLPTPGWDDRRIRMQRFGWNADGTPDFGTPRSSSELVAVPAGQCKG